MRLEDECPTREGGDALSEGTVGGQSVCRAVTSRSSQAHYHLHPARQPFRRRADALRADPLRGPARSSTSEPMTRGQRWYPPVAGLARRVRPRGGRSMGLLPNGRPPDFTPTCGTAAERGYEGVLPAGERACAAPPGLLRSRPGSSWPFIASNEISPIWAHFNVLPMSVTKPVTVDPSGTAQEIIDSAHKAGMAITINHPYIAYGYFTADDNGMIPGGYSPDFDMIKLRTSGTRSWAAPTPTKCGRGSPATPAPTPRSRRRSRRPR
jgi:hypothetical protein